MWEILAIVGCALVVFKVLDRLEAIAAPPPQTWDDDDDARRWNGWGGDDEA